VVREIRVVPAVVPIGESVTIAVELANEGSSTERLLVDLRVHVVKAKRKPARSRQAEGARPRATRRGAREDDLA
jgi:hypothetical protein